MAIFGEGFLLNRTNHCEQCEQCEQIGFSSLLTVAILIIRNLRTVVSNVSKLSYISRMEKNEKEERHMVALCAHTRVYMHENSLTLLTDVNMSLEFSYISVSKPEKICSHFAHTLLTLCLRWRYRRCLT